MSQDLLPAAESQSPEIGPGAPLPHHLRIVAERLALVAESVAWDLPQVDGQPLQGQALRDWASARADKVGQHTTELGLALWMVKLEMGHGGWLGWLQESGIPQRTAQDAMQLARTIFAAPAAAVPVLTSLPRRKLQALAPGGQQLLEALAMDGTLAEVPEMSREEIRSLVRERLETARLRESLDTVAAQRDEASAELRRQAALPSASRRLSALRLAALEEIEQARVAGLALGRVLEELEQEPAGVDELGFDAACHALAYGLQGLYSLTVAALNRAYDLRDHYTAGQQFPPPIYEERDAYKAEGWAAQFQPDSERRRARRAAEALEPLPAGPGRGQRKGAGR
jgi:hypothetical protein